MNQIFAQKDRSEPVPPRNLLAILAAGFEQTTNHLWLVVLPLLLDVFFWIGPRLGMQEIIERNLALFAGQPGFETVHQMMAEVAPRTNLFNSLSLPLIGVPTLMAGPTPEKTPILPLVVELNSVWAWMLLFVLFTALGTLLSGLYLTLIATSLQEQRVEASQFIRKFLTSTINLVLLIISVLITLFILAMIMLPIWLVISLLSQGAAALVGFLALVLALWLIIYMSFSVHDIYLNASPFWLAIWKSTRLVQQFLWPTMALFGGIYLINLMFAWLWQLAESGSWLTIFSIVGHGFISTSLIVATFIYFTDRVRLVKWAAPSMRNQSA